MLGSMPSRSRPSPQDPNRQEPDPTQWQHRHARVTEQQQTSFAELLFPEVATSVREAPASGTSNTNVSGSTSSQGSPNQAPAQAAAALETFAGFVPVFAVKLVRVDSLALRRGEQRPHLQRPEDVAALLWPHLEHADREHFALLLLDTRNRLIGLSTVSVGDLSSTLVHPREVFKPALLANAASVLLAHNHPSGDPQPSPEDLAVTRRLCEAGELLGIGVLDHIVLGEQGRYVSLKEKGLM